MGEPKPLASLSAGLLARKGAARPAMRRQPLGSGPAPIGAGGYDDLGWNDMGYDVNPHQSADPAHMVDLKPLLSASLPAHDPEAETPAALETDDDKLLPQSLQDEWAEQEAANSDPLPWPSAATEAAPLSMPVSKPAVVRQQEELVERVEAVPVVPSSKPAPGKRAPRALRAREKAAFTLRLDAERHLRLRLASAVNNRSAQTILTSLLDDYLASLPEIDAMASRLPAAKPKRNATNNGEVL